MADFTILHLSDVHFGLTDLLAERPMITSSLVKAVHNAKKRPDLCIFSGDLANSGKPEEFTEGVRWLSEVLNPFDCPLAIVPGNHDLLRDNQQKSLPKDRYPTLESYQEDRDDLKNQTRFESFLKFCSRPQNTQSVEYLFDWSKSLLVATTKKEFRGVTVNIVGLNTAITSKGKKDEGNLIADILELNEFLHAGDPCEDCQLTIAIGHHPFNWLTGWNREMIKNALLPDNRGAHAWFCGHQHEATAIYGSNCRGQSMATLSAGASYHSSNWPQNFAFYEFELTDRRICPTIYTFNNHAKCWDVDTFQSKPFSVTLPQPNSESARGKSTRKRNTEAMGGDYIFPASQEPNPSMIQSVYAGQSFSVKQWVIIAIINSNSYKLVADSLDISDDEISLLLSGNLHYHLPYEEKLRKLVHQIAGIDFDDNRFDDILKEPPQNILSLTDNDGFKHICNIVINGYAADRNQFQIIKNALSKAIRENRPLNEEELIEVYKLSSVFINPYDMDSYARGSFDKDLWQRLIIKPQDPGNTKPENHLHYSNLLTGDLIARKFFEWDPPQNRPIRILEGGVGGANSTMMLLRCIDQYWSQIRRRRCVHKPVLTMEYRGYDINPVFAIRANEIMNGQGENHDPRTDFFRQRSKYTMPWQNVQEAQPEMSEKRKPNELKPFVCGECMVHGIGDLAADDSNHESVHVFICNYAFHHVPNGRYFLEYLFGNSLNIKSVKRYDFSKNSNVFATMVFRFLKNPNLELNNKDIFNIDKFAYGLTKYLDVSADYHTVIKRDLERFLHLNPGKKNRGVPDSMLALFRNYQFELLENIYQLLVPGGLLSISDPDGFSKFNAENVKHDPEMSVAHFLTRLELYNMLERIGFDIIESMDIAKLRGSAGEFSPIDNDSVPLESSEDFEDANLGYLIVARKKRHPGGSPKWK